MAMGAVALGDPEEEEEEAEEEARTRWATSTFESS